MSLTRLWMRLFQVSLVVWNIWVTLYDKRIPSFEFSSIRPVAEYFVVSENREVFLLKFKLGPGIEWLFQFWCSVARGTQSLFTRMLSLCVCTFCTNLCVDHVPSEPRQKMETTRRKQKKKKAQCVQFSTLLIASPFSTSTPSVVHQDAWLFSELDTTWMPRL